MKHNTDPAFVGVEVLKQKQRTYLEKFKDAAARGDWMAIHEDHYDWWMFPTDEPSAFGFAYTVFDGDVAELKQDTGYLEGYRLGIELLARAWSWDLEHSCYLSNPQPGQAWQEWPIRLYKAARSARLFGCQAEFESLKKLGQDLMAKGETMYYNRDLSWLFRDSP